MLESPQIIRTEVLHFAGVRRKIPVAEIRQVMDASIKQITAALEAQHQPPSGPFFTHHFCKPIEHFDFEVGFPVERPIAPDGEVHAKVWPGMTVARTVFHGNYAGLPGAWGELEKWMQTNGHQGLGEFWERYTVSPHTHPNPEDWRTELSWPLAN